MYYVDYHTGAGNEYAKTLEEAMSIADKGAEYTQQDISIIDENGTAVAERTWEPLPYDEDFEDAAPILFGEYGFYRDWCCLAENRSAVYQDERHTIYEGDGFWISRDPLERIWFEDENAICQLISMPEDPDDIVWNEHRGWIFRDGSELPYKD